MHIPDPYFKDVPEYGDLRMEEILEDYDYPLLSVLRDMAGNRYLCMCYDSWTSQQWLVSPVPDAVLLGVLKNEVTVYDAFRKRDTRKVLVNFDYDTRIHSFELVDADLVPEPIYPDPRFYLDADPGDWDEYMDRIESECKREEASS